MNEEKVRRISNDLIKIYNYCLFVEKREDKWSLDEIKFFKHIRFGFLCEDENGRIVVHPQNYYKDFYLDNDDNPIYCDIDNDFEDGGILMIDVFMLHENEGEARQIIIKKLTYLYLRNFEKLEELKNETRSN